MLRFSLDREPVHHGHIIFSESVSLIELFYCSIHVCIFTWTETSLWFTIPPASRISLVVKNPPARQETRDMGSGPWAGEYDNPFQYSCFEDLTDRGSLWATVLQVTESDTTEISRKSLLVSCVQPICISGMWAKLVKCHLNFFHRSGFSTLKSKPLSSLSLLPLPSSFCSLLTYSCLSSFDAQCFYKTAPSLTLYCLAFSSEYRIFFPLSGVSSETRLCVQGWAQPSSRVIGRRKDFHMVYRLVTILT